MNQVYYTQGLAHDKIMPANYYREFGEHHDDRIPYGAEVLEDGRVRFTLYAPGAKQAAVCCNMDKYVLEKKEDGMWKTDAGSVRGIITSILLLMETRYCTL